MYGGAPWKQQEAGGPGSSAAHTSDEEWWWTGVVGLADQVDRGKHAGEEKKIARGEGGFRGPN